MTPGPTFPLYIALAFYALGTLVAFASLFAREKRVQYAGLALMIAGFIIQNGDVRAVIRGLGQEHTILLSTHILSEVETTCDRALVISRGQLVAEGTLEQLRSRRESRSVKVLLRDPEGRAEALLRSSEAVEELTAVRRDGDLLALELRLCDADEAAGERLVRMLVESGIGVRELGPIKASLEQVFAELTEAEPRA